MTVLIKMRWMENYFLGKLVNYFNYSDANNTIRYLFIAEAFITKPENVKASVGDVVHFKCSVNKVFEENFIYLTWEYQLVGGEHPLTFMLASNSSNLE